MSDNMNENQNEQENIDITEQKIDVEKIEEFYEGNFDEQTDIQDTQDNQEESEVESESIEPEIDISEIEIPEIAVTQEMVDAVYFLPDEEKKRFSEELFDWIEIFSSALLTVILLFTFILRLVTVQGPSMEHTLHGGDEAYGSIVPDNLIISNLFYTPKQGDIVVIQVPNPSYPTPIIKRVIATEGQLVDFDFENWKVIIYEDEDAYNSGDGIVLHEPYVNYEEGRYMNGSENNLSLPIKVEKGKIFVMGDNRNHSSDSRSSSIGQVDVRNVVGRVLLRVFPLNKFGVLKIDAEE